MVERCWRRVGPCVGSARNCDGDAGAGHCGGPHRSGDRSAPRRGGHGEFGADQELPELRLCLRRRAESDCDGGRAAGLGLGDEGGVGQIGRARVELDLHLVRQLRAVGGDQAGVGHVHDCGGGRRHGRQRADCAVDGVSHILAQESRHRELGRAHWHGPRSRKPAVVNPHPDGGPADQSGVGGRGPVPESTAAVGDQAELRPVLDRSNCRSRLRRRSEKSGSAARC